MIAPLVHTQGRIRPMSCAGTGEGNPMGLTFAGGMSPAKRPGDPMAKLVCRAGPDAGHEYPLATEKTVFGRRQSCDVPIMDSMASREHFVIRREGRLYTISDLESRNGTRVNGRKITERQLEFGDVVQVGEVEWILVKEEGDVELRDLLTSKYEILEKIGEGGMGIVYKAIQRSMDRTVALKVLAPKYAARPRFVNHFIEEARAAGRLNHPNIIQVHDVDSENGVHYFSMEFVEGSTCTQLLHARGPFGPAEALEITRLTAKALQYAHENRIIHRDVKPDNIMVGINNLVKLADLGISRTFDEAAAENSVKRIVGTPQYMAPEVARGQRIDHRVDIYSLGATLHQLLTGQQLFPDITGSDLLKAHVKKIPRPPSSIDNRIPPTIDELVAELVAKDPSDRPATAQKVVARIDRLQSESGLAPELPANGETQMLRMFAAGKTAPDPAIAGAAESPAAPAKPAPARPRSANRTPSRSNSTATRQHSGGGGGGGAVKAILIIMILGLGGALVYQLRGVISSHLGNEAGSQPEPPTTTSTPPIVSQNDEDPTGADDQPAPPTDPHAAARNRLDTLAARLASDPQSAALKEIRAALDQLSLEQLPPDLLTRLGGLRDTLDELTRLREEEQANDALVQLRSEIETLLQQDDFDGAVARLQSHQGSDSERVRQQIAHLQQTIEESRDSFVERTRAKIESLKIRLDADGLRALKAVLPPSLLDDAIAEEIQQAINQIDDQIYAKYRGVVDDALTAFLDWDLDRVAKMYRDEHARIQAQTLQAELQLLNNSAQVLKELGARVQAAIDAKQDERITFRGRLQNYPDPYLIGADAAHLQIKVSTGTAQVQWSRLKKQEYAQVLMRTLGGIPDDLRQALDHFFEQRDAAQAAKEP